MSQDFDLNLMAYAQEGWKGLSRNEKGFYVHFSSENGSLNFSGFGSFS